jgi:hypothetical protein
VTDNSNSTLREVVELSVSHESIRTILANHLGMKHVAARLVRRPEFSPTINRMRVAEDMLERVNSEPIFLRRIVTGNETFTSLT